MLMAEHLKEKNKGQYGNIHLATLTKKAGTLFNKQLPTAGLHLFEEGYYFESFGKAGKIVSRKLSL